MHIVHERPRVLDPDDTSHCPIPDEVTDCTLCAGEEPGELLEVVTARTDLGVVCLVVCDVCARGPAPLRPLPIGAALHAVMAHAEHLDADLDEIAAAVAAKDAR